MNVDSATKYISSLYDVSHNPLKSEQIVFGLSQVEKKLSVDIPLLDMTPYIISGEGESESVAWHNFWIDFDQKTGNDEKRNIFWRYPVEVLNDRDFESKETNYRVQCRFSLVE